MTPNPHPEAPHTQVVDPILECKYGFDHNSVAVYCWCDRKMLTISLERFRAGLTDSCGRPDCRPDTNLAAA